MSDTLSQRGRSPRHTLSDDRLGISPGESVAAGSSGLLRPLPIRVRDLLCSRTYNKVITSVSGLRGGGGDLFLSLVDRGRFLLLAVAFLLLFGGGRAAGQSVGVKSNLLYLATTTPNLGVDFRMADHWSMSFHGSYNPFLFPQWTDEEGNTYNPKIIHWGVMPELKYWFCRTYERSFIGLHGIYGQFNVGGIPFIDRLRSVRYHGQLYGGGISYGYQFAIGSRWGLELSLGAGYLAMLYDRCDAYVCGDSQGQYRRDYVGPTKLAVTLVYFIK